jgi:hypothetical protein
MVEARTGEKGAHGKEGTHAGHACGARTAKGGHARPRGTYVRAPWDGHGLPPRGWRGCIRARPSLGHERGARTASRKGLYIFCHPHLKLPSLLLLAPCLAPTKCFAWDFEG